MDPDWEVPKIQLLSFDDVAEQLQQFEDLGIYPDFIDPEERGLVEADDDTGWDVVDLRTARFTSAGSVQIPGFKLLKMSDWSKRQIGNEIGVRWDQFFGDTPADEINLAIANHLRHRPDSAIKRIIARNFSKEEAEDKVVYDGLLRGLVNPTYSEVTDVRFFDRLERIAGRSQLDDMGFIQAKITDVGTHLSLVYREQIDMLGSGRVSEDLGEQAYYGAKIRNSVVGAYSLTGDVYALRLICTNGLMAATQMGRLLYRRHVFIDNVKLDKLISDMMLQLPERRDLILENNNKLSIIPIKEPENHIRAFLARKGQSKAVQETAVEAYQREPNPTGYGILQAITRLGMSIRRDPDKQFDIELIAGNYIDEMVNREAA